MKTQNKISHGDVLVWAREAELRLPDQWASIQKNLPKLEAANTTSASNWRSLNQSSPSRKRLLVAWAALLVLLLIGGLIASGQFDQLVQSGSGNQYTQATANPSLPTATRKQTTSATSYSEGQLAFSDRANDQYALMEKAQIPDQYAYYAGSFIEDAKVFVIQVTSRPEDFIKAYADLLDFSIIEVRQVKYTLKQLQTAYAPLYQEFSSSDKLSKLGIYGMAVFEQHNAIGIVVQKLNEKVRQSLKEIVADPNMVVFEVDGRIQR